MRSMSRKWAVLIAGMVLIASCGGGGGGGSPQTACTTTENMKLHSSSTGTTLLSSVTVSAIQYIQVAPFPVFVEYTSPPVAAIVAGYSPGAVDPRTVGMDIAVVVPPPANPIEVDLTFDPSLAKDTYTATWRFVALDANANIVGCNDLPTTFTIQ